MQVEARALLNTKMWVPRKEAMAVQNALLKVPEFGYELALSKSKAKQKLDRKCAYVAFFIDHSGYIEYYECYTDTLEADYGEFRGYKEEEINYEVTLSN